MIQGAEVALHRERPASELRETLQVNLEVLRELAGLVTNMQFLARADKGELAEQLCAMDLRAEAEHVAEYFEPLLEQQNLRLLIEGDARAVANPTLIRRALVNLVGNATRYTADGGAIHVDIGAHGDQVRMAVRNPGVGIPAELLPRLFDRFVRGDSARQHSGSHQGLGLAIVRAIAVMHGGRVFARSDNGWTEIGLEWPSGTTSAG
jgi:two-component system, OmpR family, heavy metal sensor histidine kinase CusS